MGFRKWLVPGLKIKRWLACLFAGILCLALGVKASLDRPSS